MKLKEEQNYIKMKKLEIKTDKATLLVVDLPYPEIWISRAGISFPNGKGGEHFISGNFKHIGKVSEITEEDWRGIVDSIIHYEPWTQYQAVELFYNYESKGFSYTYTSTESGLSLLKANGVLLENPLGSKPFYDEIVPKKLIKEGYGSNDFVDVLYDLHQWESAQELVWSNPHIFIKTI